MFDSPPVATLGTAEHASLSGATPIYLDDFDPFVQGGVAVRGDFSDLERLPDRWVLVDNVCGARRRRVLCAAPETRAGSLIFTPGLRGRYAIHVSYLGAAGTEDAIYIRLAHEPRFARFACERTEPVFQEVLFEIAELEPSSRIEIASLGACTLLNYVKLTPAPVAPRARPAAGRLIGICDPPVNLLSHKPAGREAATCVRLHQEAGYDLLLWKVYKVLCEYDTKVGVRRDMGVDYDTLRQAVDEAKRIGLELYGWFRVSNEQIKLKATPGNADGSGLFEAATPFHLAHPEMRMRRKDGQLRPRLSFAYPEVRRHKIDLICEVVGYGVDGICIDVLRHPPMAEYDLPLVEAFMERTGQDPRLMPGDGSEEWLRFRCEAFTQFLRETRAAIDHRAGRRLPLMIRTLDQPWRNLQAGCDVEGWIDEGLVDSLLLAPHLPSGEYAPRSLDLRGYIDYSAGRTDVLAQVWRYGSLRDADAVALDAYDQGVRGVAFYESGVTVQRPSLWESLRRFRGRAELEDSPS